MGLLCKHLERMGRKVLQVHKTPLIWLRYIDDILGIWLHRIDKLKLFCDHVNSIHSQITAHSIQHTVCTLATSTMSIRFLDIEFYLCQHKLLHRVGFKFTDSFRILPPNSFHQLPVFNASCQVNFLDGVLATPCIMTLSKPRLRL